MKSFLSFLIISLFVIGCESKKKQFIPLLSIAEPEMISGGSSNLGGQTAIVPTGPTSENSSSNEGQSGSDTSSNQTSFSESATVTIPVETNVTDNEGNPIESVTVTITNPENGEVILQETTNSNGDLSGNITIPSTTTEVEVTVNSGNATSTPIQVPVEIPVVNEETIPTPIVINPILTCQTDKDRGHGNDLDGVDEDNPGKSKGVNANGMANRNENSLKDKDGECKVKLVKGNSKNSSKH